MKTKLIKTKTATIRVTADDITKGEPSECRCCPIALAMQRRFPRSKVNVGRISFRVGKWHGWLPESAQDFICNFDDNYLVKPFTFRLKLQLTQ